QVSSRPANFASTLHASAVADGPFPTLAFRPGSEPCPAVGAEPAENAFRRLPVHYQASRDLSRSHGTVLASASVTDKPKQRLLFFSKVQRGFAFISNADTETHTSVVDVMESKKKEHEARRLLVVRQATPGCGGPLGPIDLRKLVPFEPSAASDLLGWVGLEAARYRAAPASEINLSPLTHHTVVLITRPPEELDLRYEGVTRHVAPPAGSILVVPAGSPARWRWSGPKDSLHIYLEPELVARVAAEAFGLDPARMTL